MKIHANAKLTPLQRAEVRRLHWEEHVSQRQLAARFGVNPTTIKRWVHRSDPHDRSSRPHRPGRKAKDADTIEPVVAHRLAHPHHGPLRIVQERRRQNLPAPSPSTLGRALRQRRLSGPRPRCPRTPRPIPVGRHRVQMDLQQLPAVQGSKGFEYKITAIHLRTRYKYSEIHPDRRSETVAGVLTRAAERLPPFWLVWTDNAWEFTMKYTAHPQRRSAFEQEAARQGLIHARSDRASPWQNGIVERSNRTDNEELFHRERFEDSEHRRYRLWLWESHYNHDRPHQALGGQAPMDIFVRDYRCHASARMLT